MANFTFAALGRLVVAVADARPPLDEEWARYLKLHTSLEHERAGDLSPVRTLFFTDGGTPTASQRVATLHLRRGHGVDTAVVSDSPFIHSLATMLGFINPGMRFFTSAQWQEAAEFVGLPEARQAEVLALAAVLARDIGEVKVLHSLGV
jgi:hypothetical protein